MVEIGSYYKCSHSSRSVIPDRWSQIQAAYNLHKMFTDYPWGNFTQPAPLKQSHLEQNQNKVLSKICKQHLCSTFKHNLELQLTKKAYRSILQKLVRIYPKYECNPLKWGGRNQRCKHHIPLRVGLQMLTACCNVLSSHHCPRMKPAASQKKGEHSTKNRGRKQICA